MSRMKSCPGSRAAVSVLGVLAGFLGGVALGMDATLKGSLAAGSAKSAHPRQAAIGRSCERMVIWQRSSDESPLKRGRKAGRVARLLRALSGEYRHAALSARSRQT